ncbi:YeeE/YedE [Variovorax sp. WS11]|uniref:YeeE/YedE family protein n=1 Tax=Variovorax sp. WS11 TaxID=1105204 RepID=UPI000D0C9DBA|nr:YeeE/YedE family protein [Variovorax sp. WS11]NDZ16036.1 YeeE/YedE family protein [Variovorax sp. WS11]PSL83281.1 YeeE/YedE [Variovorax sp. WS11]
MRIDWFHFTPWSALAGGLLIGLSAAMFLLLNGRIAGISGIVGGMLQPGGGQGWRLAFVAGLLAAPWAWQLAHALPPVAIAASTPVLVVAGLLVGVGTRYASGCTSGHGVCGLSRGSPRSLAATAAFMGAGFAMVYITRHLLGA